MDPRTGRFASVDRFAGLNTRPKTLHKYSYSNDDPVNYHDPSGRFAMASVGIALAVTVITIPILDTGQHSWRPGEYPHNYELETPVCSVGSLKCTPARAWRALKFYPVEGKTPGIETYTGEITAVSIYGMGIGDVRHIVLEGSHTIINETLPNHWMKSGTVTRSIRGGGGSVVIRTVGQGVNTTKMRAAMNVPRPNVPRA